MIKIIETPRDGFQGLSEFIPTKQKIDYINSLMTVGFDTVEVGSFVSEKAIPQMRDTTEVLDHLEKQPGGTKVMVLVANQEKSKIASRFSIIDYLLYPFSVSETFLKRNIKSNFAKSKDIIKGILEVCSESNKELIVYLSFGFGNPYGDPWSVQAVVDWAGYLKDLGLRIIPLSDILGDVTPDRIVNVYTSLTANFPDVEFGIHLHAKPDHWLDKVDAAYNAGVRRFDVVAGGFGGCPMAHDTMVSNLNTLELIRYCLSNGIYHGIDHYKLREINSVYSFGGSCSGS